MWVSGLWSGVTRTLHVGEDNPRSCRRYPSGTVLTPDDVEGVLHVNYNAIMSPTRVDLNHRAFPCDVFHRIFTLYKQSSRECICQSVETLHYTRSRDDTKANRHRRRRSEVSAKHAFLRLPELPACLTLMRLCLGSTSKL